MWINCVQFVKLLRSGGLGGGLWEERAWGGWGEVYFGGLYVIYLNLLSAGDGASVWRRPEAGPRLVLIVFVTGLNVREQALSNVPPDRSCRCCWSGGKTGVVGGVVWGFSDVGFSVSRVRDNIIRGLSRWS